MLLYESKPPLACKRAVTMYLALHHSVAAETQKHPFPVSSVRFAFLSCFLPELHGYLCHDRRGLIGSGAACSRSVPQPIDSMWSNNPVRMRLPPGGVPASYPQIKLPVLDNPALFEKLDTEALFFAFYYMPGTHQQYLAARELKRQSWRYHKQHGAWFQVCLVVDWHFTRDSTSLLSDSYVFPQQKSQTGNLPA